MRNSKSPEGGRATLSAVAATLGVSTATVSRALHKPHLLNARTVERVKLVVDQMGYRPHFLAQHLKTGRTHNVLVIVPTLGPSCLEMLRGVEAAASGDGYFVIIAQSGHDPCREDQYFDQVSSGRADGVLLLSCAKAGKIRTNKYELPPIVSVLDADPADPFPSVTIDHKAAAVAATNYLIGLGHRRIAHIPGSATSRMALQRREGFLQAMEAANLAVFPDAASEEGDVPEAGERAAKSLLSSPQLPTAVFAASDELAVGALKAVVDAGLRVPEDISIIGFDNLRLSRIYNPALTTVGMPAFELGYLGMDKLLKIIKGEACLQDELLETSIIERATTSRLLR